jgi:acetylornithine deacetylase
MISATALPRLPRVAPSEAIELNARLVALDTVNTELVPGAPGQRAAVELLVARLYYAGFEIEIVASPERPSLLATDGVAPVEIR